jgi:hypothetical protein
MKTSMADALGPILARFDGINKQPLRAVWQFVLDDCLDRVILDFDSVSLVIASNPDDDTIQFWVVNKAQVEHTGGVDASQQQHWQKLIGKQFGWGWLTINQQGYSDGLLLSFGGMIPQLVLNVVASSIKVGTITIIRTS